MKRTMLGLVLGLIALGAGLTTVTATVDTVSEFQPRIRWGGRAVAVTLDPSDPRQAIVASESGGLFKTVDSGLNWFHINNLPMFRIIDVRYAPDPAVDVVIASGWGDSRTQNQGGIWRSADGGVSWSRPTSASPTGLGCSGRAAAHGIAFEPGSTNVYVGTDCGLAISNDLGVTWRHVVPQRASPGVVSVAASAGGIVDVCTGSNHLRSTNSGTTFGTPTSGSGGCSSPHGLAVSVRESAVVFQARFVPLPRGCEGGASALFEGDYQADGTVSWAQVSPTTCLNGAGRKPWVATTVARSGDAAQIDVYFSDGYTTWRRTCSGASSSGRRCGAMGWTETPAGHVDHNDMAFHANGCPAYLLSDGGIHPPAATSDPRACGSSFPTTIAGSQGYSALQIYQVTGQLLTDHTDMYIGTQDNGLWASSNSGSSWPYEIGGEGFYIQVPRRATNDSGQTVTFSLIGARDADRSLNSNRRSDAHLATMRTWSNPGGNPPVDNPTLLGPSAHIQYSMASPPSSVLNVTTDNSDSWTAVTTLPQARASWPQVAFSGDEATIYQAVTRPGSTIGGDDLFGLVKITGLRRDGSFSSPAISRADVSGLGSIGIYPAGEGTFLWGLAYGVDPRNPNHLLAADVSDSRMKYTLNGQDWLPDQQLTDLITGLDGTTGRREFRFNIPRNEDRIRTPGAVLQPHAIAFDPFVRNHILVGTEAAGIFRSTDGGLSWALIPGSRSITGVTSFFFRENTAADPNNYVIVSSYGRGLWKLTFRPVNRPYGFNEELAALWSSGVIQDPYTGDVITLEQFTNPDYCPICQFLVLTGGLVRDIKMDQQGVVQELALDKGHLVGSDVSGQPVLPGVPTRAATTDGSFSGCPACNQALKEGKTIKGLVLEGGVLRAIIVASGELPGEEIIRRFDAYPPAPQALQPLQPISEPYLQLLGPVALGGQPTVPVGEEVRLFGSGFSSDASCSAVSVELEDQKLPVTAQVGQDGRFSAAVVVNQQPGSYLVKVTQSCGSTVYEDMKPLVVVIRESEDEEIGPLWNVVLPLLTR